MDLEPNAYPDIEADTKLLNIHHLSDVSDVDVYIGPESTPVMEEISDRDVEIDLQNPFSVARYGRNGSVENYKAYFYREFLLNEDFRQNVKSLRGKTICDTSFPKYGHGQVIVRFVHRMEELSTEKLFEYIRQRLEDLNPNVLAPAAIEYREEALDKIYKTI